MPVLPTRISHAWHVLSSWSAPFARIGFSFVRRVTGNSDGDGDGGGDRPYQRATTTATATNVTGEIRLILEEKKRTGPERNRTRTPGGDDGSEDAHRMVYYRGASHLGVAARQRGMVEEEGADKTAAAAVAALLRRWHAALSRSWSRGKYGALTKTARSWAYDRRFRPYPTQRRASTPRHVRWATISRSAAAAAAAAVAAFAQ